MEDADRTEILEAQFPQPGRGRKLAEHPGDGAVSDCQAGQQKAEATTSHVSVLVRSRVLESVEVRHPGTLPGPSLTSVNSSSPQCASRRKIKPPGSGPGGFADERLCRPCS